jgi:hypothetical protein
VIVNPPDNFTLRSLSVAGIVAIASLVLFDATAQSTDDEFTDEDFAQFFGLLVDGKITKEKLNQRCAGKAIGFTFAAAHLVQEGPPERIEYNATGLKQSIDGRSLRSKHHNAAFGEWTGSVFKPICPGLYVISVDFSTSGKQGDVASTVLVHLYLRRAGETRPGKRLVTAVKTGPSPRGNGHGTISLPLRTGDEVSTYAESEGAQDRREFESVTFTAYKIAHLDEYIEEFDMEAWGADIEALN